VSSGDCAWLVSLPVKFDSTRELSLRPDGKGLVFISQTADPGRKQKEKEKLFQTHMA